MKKHIIISFYGYHESGKKTETKFDILSFDPEDEINMNIITEKLSKRFSSFRDNGDIFILSMQGF